jgi:hypothetical protein
LLEAGGEGADGFTIRGGGVDGGLDGESGMVAFGGVIVTDGGVDGAPVGGELGGLGRLTFKGIAGVGVPAVLGLTETAGLGGCGITGMDTAGLFADASPSFIALVIHTTIYCQ